MATNKPTDVDEYIAGFPKEVQKILQQIRETIKKAAPEAEETISYAIPAFTFKGKYLVYFAGFKNHIGMYPVPIGNKAFKEFSLFKTGKGSIQFPLEQPMPLSLVTKIVEFRIKKISEIAEKKKK